MSNNSINTMLPEPQQRNFYVVFTFMISSLAICTYMVYKGNYTKALAEVVFLIIMALIVFVGIEILNRFCYLFDELIKIKVEHGGSIIQVLKAAFSFNIPSAVIVLGSFFFPLVIYFNTEKTSCSFCPLSNIGLITSKKDYLIALFFALVFSFFLVDSANIRECRAQKIEVLNRLGGLDYGSSMACSYFYGYLKIILPADGKENGGLLQRIEDFEANELKNETMPVRKLFILIPASFYIPPNLQTISKDWLEPMPEKLKFIKLDRAGVAKREYKNTAYKIHPGGYDGSGKPPVYVVTEGATPMMTYFEVQQQKHRYSEVYTEYKREIAKKFYRTLEQLLNDNPDCRNVCELVYYEDYDENGKAVNPGEILLRRIEEQSC